MHCVTMHFSFVNKYYLLVSIATNYSFHIYLFPITFECIIHFSK